MLVSKMGATSDMFIILRSQYREIEKTYSIRIDL